MIMVPLEHQFVGLIRKIMFSRSLKSLIDFSCCFFLVVRLLREELQLLQEQGSYVGEVVKPMDKKKVLVKVGDGFC